MIIIAMRIWAPLRGPAGEAPEALRPAARLAALGGVLVYTQMILGALVRHTSAGLACNNDMVLCKGELWPTGPGSGPAILHMSHRLLGVMVALFVICSALAIYRRARAAGRRDLVWLAAAGSVLVCGQVLLGMWTVRTFIAAPIVTAHLAGAELLLAQQLVTHLLARTPRPAPVAAPGATLGAGQLVTAAEI